MTKPSFKMLAGATASVAVLGFLTLPAFAGFEWRGPAPVANDAPVASAPGDDTGLSGLEPVVSWDGSPKMPAQKVAPVEASPIEAPPAARGPMPLVPSADRLPISAPASANNSFTPPGEIVTGFGSDLPLAIALPQITPPGYQYAFAPGVDAGTRVSWDGGKGWKNVLSDALADKGLGFEMQGNTIKVVRGATRLPAEDVPPLGMQTVSVTPPGGVLQPPESRIANAGANIPLGEPVTIRRQKPSLLARKNKKTTDVIVGTAPPSDLAEGQLPESGFTPSGPMPADDTNWDAPPPDAVSPPQAMAPVPVPVPVPAPLPSVAPLAPPPVSNAPMPITPATGLTAAESLTAALPQEPQPIAAPVPALPPEGAPSAPAMASSAAEKSATWQATRGQTLREVLTAWSEQANVELYWSIDYDYKILKNFNSNRSFEDAVGTLLEQFTEARPQPYGQLHQSSRGPRVLVIRSYDLAQ